VRKLLVFQHVPLEPLGSLDPLFKEAGFRIRYVNFDREPRARVNIARYHGLVVLGGPQSADATARFPHLAYEQDAIRAAVVGELPVLGICLGAQLMAASFGGKTLRGQGVEYGWSRVAPTELGRSDPLIGHFDGPESIYQWHSDTFTLPKEARHLASSPRCLHQAFRIGDSAYGLQFHLEADRALIRRWLATTRHLEDLGVRGVAIDADRTDRLSSRHLPRAERLGRLVFGEFIRRFYGFRRRRALPSR
jgi:GMP synthase (glutamine-hydrolysing)